MVSRFTKRELEFSRRKFERRNYDREEFERKARDDEAEACAKIADSYEDAPNVPDDGMGGDISREQVWVIVAAEIARAIRQRIKARG